MAKDLADDIMDMMQHYCRELNEEMFKEAQKLTKKAVAELKATSPKRTGDYGKSWRLTKFGRENSRFRFVVHNEEYQLTHLLEDGFLHHPDMNQIDPQPHIDKVQEWLNDEFEVACERIINKT